MDQEGSDGQGRQYKDQSYQWPLQVDQNESQSAALDQTGQPQQSQDLPDYPDFLNADDSSLSNLDPLIDFNFLNSDGTGFNCEMTTQYPINNYDCTDQMDNFAAEQPPSTAMDTDQPWQNVPTYSETPRFQGAAVANAMPENPFDFHPPAQEWPNQFPPAQPSFTNQANFQEPMGAAGGFASNSTVAGIQHQVASPFDDPDPRSQGEQVGQQASSTGEEGVDEFEIEDVDKPPCPLRCNPEHYYSSVRSCQTHLWTHKDYKACLVLRCHSYFKDSAGGEKCRKDHCDKKHQGRVICRDCRLTYENMDSLRSHICPTPRKARRD